MHTLSAVYQCNASYACVLTVNYCSVGQTLKRLQITGSGKGEGEASPLQPL